MDFTAIKNRIYFLADTDSVALPVADLTSMVNRANEHVASLILMADIRWRWDDSNQTDLPIATAALVANQQDYSISSTHLIIERVEIKDSGGAWHLLTPLDQSDLKRNRYSAMDEYEKGSGVPREYDLVGESVFLYPKPSYSQASSLKIHFARAPVAFETTDDTEEPGFNSLFHDLLPLLAAYEYVSAKRDDTTRASYLLVQIQNKEKAAQDFYGKRQNAYRGGFSVSQEGDSKGGYGSNISGRHN